MTALTAQFSRRRLLAGLAVTGISLPARSWGQADGFRVLQPQPGSARLRGPDMEPTPVWAYEGTVPGPLLRVKRGEEVKVRLVNGLAEATSVHWHGLRIANAMDGAAPLTQKPIEPGQSFDYRFRPPDAGTFWYHPHVNGSQQLDRGLYGLLIVDESERVAVDRDVVLVLDDWRLTAEGKIEETFGNPHDAAHEGRIGAHFTVNGAPAFDIAVKTNERVRLRLLNAANARVITLRIDRHSAWVMAIDGQPAEPFIARDSRVSIGPGNRVDFFLDATLQPGAVAPIVLQTEKGEVTLARLVYEAGPPARPGPLPNPKPLPANPLPERMDFRGALKLDIPIEGGATAAAPQPAAKGGHPGHGGHGHSTATGTMHWTLSGRASTGHDGKPLFSVKRGRTVMLGFLNKTAFPHSMHLHGHHFRLLDRLDDGWKPFWLDTAVVPKMDTWRIAFVADNPGKWVLHCHMLEHQDTGMGAWFEVT